MEVALCIGVSAAARAVTTLLTAYPWVEIESISSDAGRQPTVEALGFKSE